MNNLVIINEAHNILDEQESILNEIFGNGNWNCLEIPEDGLTKDQIEVIVNGLSNDTKIIFISPLPAMMKMLSKTDIEWSVFHNDIREKKELPNGRIVMTVAKTGWQLI